MREERYLSSAELGLGRQLRRSIVGFGDSPTAMAVLLPDGRLLLVNRALARLLGRTIDDVVGRSAISMLAPRERAAATVARAANVATRVAPYESRWTFSRPDGSLLPVTMTTLVVRDIAGEPWYLVSRVLPDAAAARPTAALGGLDADDRRLLRDLLAATPDFETTSTLMLISHVDGRVAAVNPAMAAFLGYRPSALTGTHVTALVPESSAAEIPIRTARLERRGMLPAETRELKSRIGSTLHARLAPIVIRDERGQPRFYLVTGHPVDVGIPEEAAARR